MQRQLAVADIPGKPMQLGDLAKLMKTDREELIRVVKDADESLQ